MVRKTKGSEPAKAADVADAVDLAEDVTTGDDLDAGWGDDAQPDGDDLATTTVSNAPSIAPPVPRRIAALLEQTQPAHRPDKPRPAWLDQHDCPWLPFFALSVGVKLNHSVREFRRAGRLFSRAPTTFYPADLEQLGEEKIAALLAEPMLICTPMSRDKAIEAYLAA